MHVWRLGSPLHSVREHERALAALRDISERAPFVEESPRPEVDGSRSIHVLGERDSTGAAAAPNAGRRAGRVPAPKPRGATRDRPTIASIPTVGWRPALWPEPPAAAENPVG